MGPYLVGAGARELLEDELVASLVWKRQLVGMLLPPTSP